MSTNTLFLRLEGPLQAWGDRSSKYVFRRTSPAPTKSGVIGMILAAMGIDRDRAKAECWLDRLSQLTMGVRVDRPGWIWWDYHTVGAGTGNLTAEGKVKITASTGEIETLVTWRQFLCDASFLVALQADDKDLGELIAQAEEALHNPVWTIYLGRKCCPPSMPILLPQREREQQPERFGSLKEALTWVPYQRRWEEDEVPQELTLYLEWRPTPEQPTAPEDAELWYDVPLSFSPPFHRPRFILKESVKVGKREGEVKVADGSFVTHIKTPERPRADYTNKHYRQKRRERLKNDQYLCVFCKSPLIGRGATAQHITYRRAGKEELEDLRSLCRLCHDAVSMLEYGAGMTLDRINPEDEKWRDKIWEVRNRIIQDRSLARRQRLLEREG